MYECLYFVDLYFVETPNLGVSLLYPRFKNNVLICIKNYFDPDTIYMDYSEYIAEYFPTKYYSK